MSPSPKNGNNLCKANKTCYYSIPMPNLGNPFPQTAFCYQRSMTVLCSRTEQIHGHVSGKADIHKNTHAKKNNPICISNITNEEQAAEARILR